ncbi:hypothetical protein ACFX1S_009380 [Malus domestica]
MAVNNSQTVVGAGPTAGGVPAASLYVGDLHPYMTEVQLEEAFKGFKGVTSVRLCRDTATATNCSLCYGYVNFTTPEEAIRALEVMNHSILNGRVIRVMWSHRDPDARRSGIGNVFVKNLSESINSVELEEMFKKFGRTLSCKVAMFDDGKSKGYGFVQFESEESAIAAIEALNGTTVKNKQLYVAKFVRKSDRVLPNPDIKYTNLYMKNLDPTLKEELVEEKFSEFGKIVSFAIAKDDHGNSRGFGFVNFENPDDARRAMEGMNGSQLGSKVLYVARAQKKAEREHLLRWQFEEKRKEQMLKFKGSNVYVKNIDDDVSEEELAEHFSQCGTITSAKIMRDDKGISKGFGFICFSTPEEGNKAVNTFHGYMFHRKPLYVAIAQRKEERQAQLQLQYAQRLAGFAGPSPTVIPGGYPPIYYQAPSGVAPQVPPRAGLMYQPLGLWPGWRPNGFVPTSGPAYQPPLGPVIPNAPRQHRQNRGRMNGHMIPQGGAYMPHLQQPNPLLHSAKDSNNPQRTGQAKSVPNGRQREMNKGGVSSAASNSVGVVVQPEMLSSMLAAASPEQQKQILGEQLYPLVHKQKADLASKITGMLLEMDNSELLNLLESPDSLTAKVEEAVQVLRMSKTKVPNKDNNHPSYLSAEVAVN